MCVKWNVLTTEENENVEVFLWQWVFSEQWHSCEKEGKKWNEKHRFVSVILYELCINILVLIKSSSDCQQALLNENVSRNVGDSKVSEENTKNYV